ncbi:hypothetical protein BD413DRAFT_165327 [Trametes elegans]|nr:hypothetical protein BD413DRAFT_165327 [Trametes elegans]
MQAHIDTETYLKESGLTYTIIREGLYSESWPLYFGFFNPAEGNDEVVVPYGDGPIAWVSREDLGEGTAKILNGFENETLLFTGSRTFSLKELADKICSLLGRNVKLAFSSEGKPGPQGNEELLRSWATSFKALERGELGVVDPFLQQLLGRELTPFEGTLEKCWVCRARSRRRTRSDHSGDYRTVYLLWNG